MKKIVIIICAILFILFIYTGIKYLKKDKYITENEAKLIATSDVSSKDNNFIFNKIDYTYTNDTYIYTLEFRDNINIYTYKIDAKTKRITSSTKELINSNLEYIDENTILDIVFKHASINKLDSNIITNAINTIDGIPIYTTIFYHNNIKYEYKTNGLTGSIISISKINEHE